RSFYSALLHSPLSSSLYFFFFFFPDTASSDIYTLSLHDALPIFCFFRFGLATFWWSMLWSGPAPVVRSGRVHGKTLCCFFVSRRSEEHTSELQSHLNLVCRLLLEKKKNI